MRRRLLKSEQGSIMILGLGFLGLLVVPLIAILYFASQGATAVSVARGTAYSSAYSGLSRSIDFDATLNSGQPQLYQVGSPELQAASTENKQASLYTWAFSGINKAMPAASAAPAALTDFAAYPSLTPAAPVYLGTVNVFGTPEQAYKSSAADCRGAEGFEADSTTSPNQIYCWVDHRAAAAPSPRITFGSNSDHYSSGAETQFDLLMPFMAGEPVLYRFKASASLAQPCLSGDCSQ